MYPYLFDWVVNGHHLRPPTYGVFLALAFSTGYFLSLKRADALGEDPRHVENLFLIVVLSSILGSRLFHVLFEEPQYYLAHPAKVFAVWEGGYTFYGALLMGMLGIVSYVRLKKISFLKWADVAALATSFGLFLGRLGCFFAGFNTRNKSTVPV